MSHQTDANQKDEDKVLEITLRPQSLDEYQGQKKVKENLKILINAAKQRQEPIEHILLYGAAGLGKTTLSHVIAREMGTGLRVTSGPAIERTGDLASILTNLSEGEILFIDECHRLNKNIEEILYPAMEDFKLDIIIGKGPSARTLELEIPRFTLIAATTQAGAISSPLRSRFGLTFRLDFYADEEIARIIKRSAQILGVDINDQAAVWLAKCSRKTPRVANRLLKRARDFAQVKNSGQITEEIAQKALSMLEIDELGLEPADRLILKTLIEKFDGGPAGLQSIAASIEEDERTIEDIYEPFLMQLGFITRTPRGRVASDLAYRHLGLTPKEGSRPLF